MRFVAPPSEAETYANVLLYGPPKTGKTAGAATAPGAVLYINADLPNATAFAKSRDPEGRIMEVEIDGLDTLGEIANAATQNPTWDAVVVDPIGELHRRLLESASNRAVRPTLNQYGDVSTHLERFCRFMCEAPVNFIIVAHELQTKDEALGTIDRIPYTGTSNPALSQKLMGMVDILGYTGVVEQEDGGRQYVAQLVNEAGRRGGDRFNVLGEWRPIDLADWFEVAGCHTERKQDNGQNAIAA